MDEWISGGIGCMCVGFSRGDQFFALLLELSFWMLVVETPEGLGELYVRDMSMLAHEMNELLLNLRSE